MIIFLQVIGCNDVLDSLESDEPFSNAEKKFYRLHVEPTGGQIVHLVLQLFYHLCFGDLIVLRRLEWKCSGRALRVRRPCGERLFGNGLELFAAEPGLGLDGHAVQDGHEIGGKDIRLGGLGQVAVLLGALEALG